MKSKKARAIQNLSNKLAFHRSESLQPLDAWSVTMRAPVNASFVFLAAAMLAAANPLARRQAYVPPSYDNWYWYDLGGNVCADGSQTGFAYNMHADANEVLIYFDSGGACWDTETCFTHPTAWNLNGYNGASFQYNTQWTLENQLLLTSRDPTKNNPWAAAHFVFVPYCTADIHGGNIVVTYPGAPAPIHHVGWTNFQNILQLLSYAAPTLSDVWVAGISAGCYGATLNYDAVRKAWPGARTHLIADSCETTPGFLNSRSSWNLQQPSQSDCPTCVAGEFNTFLPGFSQANPGSRFGSISFQQDDFLPLYMGDSAQNFEGLISQYFANITNTPTNMAKDFLVPQTGHGVMFQSNPISATGSTIASWLATMKDLGSAFKSV